jgi:hypothetical protein
MTVSGPRLYFRDRTYEARTCRDQVLEAVVKLVARIGKAEQFTTGQVAEEMLAAGSS